MSRAISVNVWVRVGAQLIDLRAGRDDFALQRPLRPPASPRTLTSVDRDADESTASSALARKIRLRSDDSSFIAA